MRISAAELRELNETITALEAKIAQMKECLEATHRRYRREIEEINQENWQRHTSMSDQLAVLQSDRDRLTATVEVLSRRLASPTADKDARRAGWRHANTLMPSTVTPTKEEARG